MTEDKIKNVFYPISGIKTLFHFILFLKTDWDWGSLALWSVYSLSLKMKNVFLVLFMERGREVGVCLFQMRHKAKEKITPRGVFFWSLHCSLTSGLLTLEYSLKPHMLNGSADYTTGWQDMIVYVKCHSDCCKHRVWNLERPMSLCIIWTQRPWLHNTHKKR